MQALSNLCPSLIKDLDPKKALFAFVIIIILNKIRSRMLINSKHSKMLEIAKNKRKQRDTQIASEFTSPNDIPEDTRNLILSSTVTKLTQLLNEDKITSEQILRVYHSRAITVGLNLELIAESNYKEALELAKKCDEIRKKTPPEDRDKLGGLFGIPFSVKDSFIQKGLDSTCGNITGCFKPEANDGELLALLKARGAIPFIRTNVPQTLAILDCINNIWGRGLNPWNKDRSIGGSSGGEAGMIAAKCSPIGLGSDGMGSLRIPASFCGVPSYKPTKGRYVVKGHSVVGPYSSSKFGMLFPNQGPIGQCVDDLTMFTKELIREEGRTYDPSMPYMAWDEKKYQSKEKMKIGYVLTEEFCGACKAAQRAVKESIEALRKLGHEVVETKIPNFQRMNLFIIMINTSEGGSTGLMKLLQGERPIPELEAQLGIRNLPNLAKRFIRKILKSKGYDRLASILEFSEKLTLLQYHEKIHEFYTLRDELLKWWNDNKFDAIITPAMPIPAYKHGYGVDLSIGSMYFWPGNIANLAAGVLPVTVVKEGEDVYGPEDSIHHDRMFSQMQESIKGSVGLPLSVQVMTLPWEDEKCLAVMKTIEDEVKFQGVPNI